MAMDAFPCELGVASAVTTEVGAIQLSKGGLGC